MAKNIIHITGNDSYWVELEVKRWLGAFVWKYGDINIDRYDLSDASSLKGIWDIILMSGLFASRRLFIFRWGRDRKSKALGLEAMLTEKLSDIPDDHFLLFHNIWEKEEWLITWLSGNADTRKIDTLWDTKAWSLRYDIGTTTLGLILSTYRDAEACRDKMDINKLLGHNIAHTIELVTIQESEGKKIDASEITNLCYGYGWDTTFAFADAIMAMNIPLSLEICHRISSSSKVDEWIGSLIGTLRNTLYIKYLKHHGSSEFEIANIVKIHPYVLKKWYSSRISYHTLREIYEKFITMSIAYKRGKWLKDSELWRVLAIELVLLGLQKTKNS
jgi:DNA polymerase III delta subunit